MGGDESGSAGQPSRVEDRGSVGDWALPRWAHRISAMAWLFVGLAVADVATQVLFRVWNPAAIGVNPGFAVAQVGSALPILLPAAILWRVVRPMPRLSEPVVAGSIALAAGLLLATGASALATLGGDARDMPPGVWVLRLVSLGLRFIGPILLAQAILRLRRQRAPRWAIGVGVAVAALAIVNLLVTVDFSMTTLLVESDDPVSDPLFVDVVRTQVVFALLGALTLLGWAYVAWAVISGAGDRTRPRAAWSMALIAVALQQVLVALSAAEIALDVMGTSVEPTAMSEAAGGLELAIINVSPFLSFAVWCLLVAAFAAGLGRPVEPAETDDQPLEIDPAPTRSA